MFEPMQQADPTTILNNIIIGRIMVDVVIDYYDNTLLHYAIYTCNKELILKLADLNADFTKVNKFGKSSYDILGSCGIKNIIFDVITLKLKNLENDKNKLQQELSSELKSIERLKKDLQNEIDENITKETYYRNITTKLKEENIIIKNEIESLKTKYALSIIRKRECEQHYLNENHRLKQDNSRLTIDNSMLGKRKLEIEDTNEQLVDINKKLEDDNKKCRVTISKLMNFSKK